MSQGRPLIDELFIKDMEAHSPHPQNSPAHKRYMFDVVERLDRTTSEIVEYAVWNMSTPHLQELHKACVRELDKRENAKVLK